MSTALTVNAGLRYEIFTAPTEEENRIVNFDLANLQLIYAGENGASDAVNLKTRKDNFAPRLGLTYTCSRGLADDPAHRLRHHVLPRAAARPRTCSGSRCPTRSRRT